jgi:hypothetical protein
VKIDIRVRFTIGNRSDGLPTSILGEVVKKRAGYAKAVVVLINAVNWIRIVKVDVRIGAGQGQSGILAQK